MPDTKKLSPLETRQRVLLGPLDAAPESPLDRFTRLAAKLLKVPMALISLVDEQQLEVASALGVSAPRRIALTDSVCKHVVASKKALVVSDARTHYELRGNRAIEEIGLVAYAGMPLLNEEQQALGAFCAIDTQPRHWSEEELEILRELASAALGELMHRRPPAEPDLFYKAVADRVEVGLLTFGVSRRITWANQAAEALFGFAKGELERVRMFDLLGPNDRESERALHGELCDGAGARVKDERRMRRKDGSWIWVRRTLSPLPSDANHKGVVLATLEQLQDHKQLVEQLQVSEDRYRAVARSLPGCALMTFDRELRHTMAEGDELFAAARLSAETVVGKTIREISSSPANARKMEQAYRAALRGETTILEVPRGERFFTFHVARMSDSAGMALIYDSTGYRRTADALEAQTALFRLLRRIAEELMRPGSGWSILRGCVGILCSELQLPVGHVFLVDGERMTSTELWQVDDALTRRPFMSATASAQFVLGQGLPGRALKEERAVLCADIARDAEFQRTGPALSSGLQAGFALPVRGRGRMVAVIECFADRPRKSTPELIDTLAIAGAMLGRVVERGPLQPE